MEISKNTIIVSVITFVLIVAFLGGVYFISSGLGGGAATNSGPTKSLPPLTSTDHAKWSSEKKINLVEYADFQCPGCANAHSALIAQLEKSDPSIIKRITYVYRYFPLIQNHQNAQVSAYAAEAAGRQGKFFAMSDKLFDNQSDWEGLPDPRDTFKKYASELKLDSKRFEADMASGDVKNRVQKDLDEGVSAGVASTPTFFLQGKKLEFRTYDEFRQKLLDVLKK